MKNTLLALFALAASTSVAAVEFVLNTPNEPVECVPTLLNWSGGRPPYTLLIQEPDANGTPIEEFPDLTGHEFSWSTDVPAGMSVGFTLTDAAGRIAQTAPVTVVRGTTSACLP